MGFFSFKTSDSNISIPNTYSIRATLDIVMIDDKGKVWIETEYEGYGIFGGKDFYEVVAEMNECKLTGNTDKDRSLGIKHYFDEEKKTKVPRLLELEHFKTLVKNKVSPEEMFKQFPAPEDCECQGFFYDEDEEDEDFF